MHHLIRGIAGLDRKGGINQPFFHALFQLLTAAQADRDRHGRITPVKRGKRGLPQIIPERSMHAQADTLTHDGWQGYFMPRLSPQILHRLGIALQPGPRRRHGYARLFTVDQRLAHFILKRLEAG